MPVEEASSEETPYGRYVTSEGWFVLNLADALAVRNEEKGGAMYPLEPREAPFGDFGANVRVVWPGDPSALYHSEGVQEGFLVLTGRVHADRRRGGAAASAVGLLPLPGRYLPRDRRSRRRAVRDSHDRCAARSRDAALPGERGRGEVRRVRRDGDRSTGRGLCRLAGRVPAGAPSVAARFRQVAVTPDQSTYARSLIDSA